MNRDQHIDNRIAGESDDAIVCSALSAADRLLRELEVDYAILGSCGLQSHFDCFLRLPNDLDVVLAAEAIEHVGGVGAALGYEFVQQLGRAMLNVDGFPVHLIPRQMNVIDKSTNTVFTRVDLTEGMRARELRRIVLVGALDQPELWVFPIETIVFVEIIRPIYTGSVANLLIAFRDLTVEASEVGRLLAANPDLQRIVQARLAEFPAAIRRMKVFSQNDRDVAAERVEALRRDLEGSLI